MLRNTLLHTCSSIFIVGLFSVFFASPAFAFSGNGSGTSGDPYQITTCSQLQEVANDLTASYLQENIIDCTGVTFTPLGISTHFTGTYDGNGFKITNLTIDSDQNYVGLFGFVGSGGVITKVGLASGSITSNVGGSETQTGGIAGENDGTITKSYSLVNVTVVSRRSYLGGITGINGGTISDSYATGTIKDNGGESEIGGIAGDDSGGQISRVYSTGSVVGEDTDGGLVGYGGGSISDSFSTASVDLSAPTVGGLVGAAGTISNSYWNKVSGSPSHCYSGGDTGCTAVDNNLSYFYTISNAPMSSWDFTSVWSNQNNGSNYPILAWEVPAPTPTPQSSGGGFSSSPSTPTCSTLPTGSPDLFQINATKNSATLFFAPVGNASNYQIAYGFTSNADQFNTFTNQGASTGVLSFAINSLPANATMYFKVYAQNDCGQGDWSNTMQVKTGSNKIYYKNFVSQVLSILPQKTTVLGARTVHTMPTSSASTNPPGHKPVSIAKTQPVAKSAAAAPKKSCFLFICL